MSAKAKTKDQLREELIQLRRQLAQVQATGGEIPSSELAGGDREAEYRLLVNNLPNVVFRGYKDWSVDFINDKIEPLTGYAKEDFHTRKIKWVDIVFSEDLAGMRGKLVAA